MATRAELESKHLAELHALAAERGLSRYRLLPRGELIEQLAGGQESDAPPASAPPHPAGAEAAPAAEQARREAAPPRRRRRPRFRRRRRAAAGPRESADRWLEAWNSHDLEAIIACYSEQVDFEIPAVQGGAEASHFRGREELRTHFRHGLELAPNLAVTEESLLVGPAGFAILYRREDGHRAVEAVELDSSGLVSRARVYYEREQL